MGESGDGGGGEKVSGGMVEGLYRQGDGYRGSRCDHSRMGDAGAHLNEAVEASPSCPWAGPSIGIQTHVNQAGPDRLPLFGAKTQSVECI
jgi:hypothetical protein